MRGITLGVMSQSKGMSHDGFLDLFPGATIAYGLRKLSKNYDGHCLKVRRSSDNVEMDVGFSGESIDLTLINNFLNGGVGYVSLLYDQSGNGLHAAQTNPGFQPKITRDGIEFDGVNDRLTTMGIPSIPKNDTGFFLTSVAQSSIGLFRVSQYDSSAGNNRVWGTHTLSSGSFYYDAGVHLNNSWVQNRCSRVTVSADKHLLIFSWAGSDSYNKASINSGDYVYASWATPAIQIINQHVEIGSINNGAIPSPGIFSEMVAYPSDLSNQKHSIEYNINNYYKLWH